MHPRNVHAGGRAQPQPHRWIEADYDSLLIAVSGATLTAAASRAGGGRDSARVTWFSHARSPTGTRVGHPGLCLPPSKDLHFQSARSHPRNPFGHSHYFDAVIIASMSRLSSEAFNTVQPPTINAAVDRASLPVPVPSRCVLPRRASYTTFLRLLE